MRKELKNIEGARVRFIATFVRFGKKSSFGYEKTTLLFENVRDRNGKEYCDHIWFTDGLQFQRLNLQAGDNICFDARVKEYWKGYRGRRELDEYKPITKDYKLSHPNNIVKSTISTNGTLF